MTTKIQKWGNSLALRLPQEIAKNLDVREGSEIVFLKKNGGLMIRPTRQSVLSLKEMVKGITPKNRHLEQDWGKPVGKEIW